MQMVSPVPANDTQWPVGQPDRCDLIVEELVPSGASRLSPFDEAGNPRAQHVSTKASTSIVCDLLTTKTFVAESTIESRFLLTAMADRTVIHIQDQPSAIQVVGPDGKPFSHTFDFHTTIESGTRVAVFAKPKDRTTTSEAQTLLQCLADSLPVDFADMLALVTEEDLPAWLVANAVLLISVQRDPWTHLHDAVLHTANGLGGSIQMRDLAAMHGGGRKAFRPCVRLIADGFLELVEPARIDSACFVRSSNERQAREAA